jgi:RimJ/RimL family protein N-acetyltransferase
MSQTSITGDDQAIALAVEEAAIGRVVGEVVLVFTSAAHRQGVVGWSIHPEAQGRGYATEAAAELLRLGFDGLGLHRITAEADPRNEASIRVMDKLGMRREGSHLETMWTKGEWVGSHVSAMLEDEWRARRVAPGD